MKVFNSIAMVLMLTVSGCVIDELTQDDLATTEQGGDPRRRGAHCVIEMSVLGDGEAPPPAAAAEICFDTFSDATYAATNGRVRLAPSVTPDMVTDELLNGTRVDSGVGVAATDTLIGILYNNRDFNTNGGTKLLKASSVCNAGVYAVNIPLDFNDTVSSTQSFAGCSYIDLFEHTNFGGARKRCGTSCAYVGDALNDRASSLKSSR